MLVLQQSLALPDDELLAEIEDRISLRRFCGLDGDAAVPSSAELRDFREELSRTRPALVRELAERRGLPDGKTPMLSIVSPVYRAGEIVEEFVRSVKSALENLTSSYELILVEDGSSDTSWLRIVEACAADPRVKGLKLTRNFGQHQAITAGLELARGEWVVVMDCDLQDDPSFLAALHRKACEGFDVVLTSRSERAHPAMKNAGARMFTALLNRLSGAHAADPLVGGYSMLSRRVVDAFLQVADVHRHYLLIVRWLGFRIGYVPVVHRPRRRGRSSYDLPKLLRHAVTGWVSHSNRLLYASVALGFSFLAAAIAGALLVVFLYFVRGFAPGWPSLVVLILVSTGSILTALGVLGIYVGKIFDQVRARPLYVVEEALNVGERVRSRPA
jgi:glycosyltransferase involved in cell wall biosynthesis